MIDLGFDDTDGACGLLAKMEHIWAGPGKDVMQNPVAWIVEKVEDDRPLIATTRGASQFRGPA